MAREAPDLAFEASADGRRYRALLEGEEVAFADVALVGADALRIRHTEVSPAHEGRGIGGALVRHMLEDARRQGRAVIPACAYAAAYIARHPEYLPYVRESERAALQARG
jgi:predicted GNAT family acetyltransferase